jgi:hypothetical protein
MTINQFDELIKCGSLQFTQMLKIHKLDQPYEEMMLFTNRNVYAIYIKRQSNS